VHFPLAICHLCGFSNHFRPAVGGGGDRGAYTHRREENKRVLKGYASVSFD